MVISSKGVQFKFQFEQIAANFAKRCRKVDKMGSGCTRLSNRTVVVPHEEASTISVGSTGEKVKKLSPSLRNPTDEVRPVSAETFAPSLNDTLSRRGKSEQRKDNVTHIKRSTSDTEQICSTKPMQKDSFSEKRSSEMLRRSHSREGSLKHYDGQANLFNWKGPKKRNKVEDVIIYSNDNKNVESSATSALPPPGQRRFKRQPTIENTVCFQEDDQINHYQIQEEIGRGSFATVYRCRSQKNQVDYAMKVISKKRLIRKNGLMVRHPKKTRSNPLDALHREIAILKKVDHPNVVKLIEVIDDPEIDNVYMVFDLIERGPAQDIPTDNPMSEATARSYFKDTVLGLEYLHYTKIIHRDIKPSNLLLDKNDHIKIADFGVSDIFEGEDDTMIRFAGSPAFQAPEAITGGYTKFSGKAADIWAMGVTLYSFIYGKCPFYDNDIMRLYDKIRNECLHFPDKPMIDPQLEDLISRLLAKDPNQRITMQEIKDHNWLTRGGRDPLPKTADHCVAIEISEEDVKNSVTLISKLSSLVLVKAVLKQRTFSSSRRREKRSSRSNSTPDISQLEGSYVDLQTRVSKSATTFYSRNVDQSSSSHSIK